MGSRIDEGYRKEDVGLMTTENGTSIVIDNTCTSLNGHRRQPDIAASCSLVECSFTLVAGIASLKLCLMCEGK